MNTAIRKLIDAGTGVPPSLMRDDTFWAAVSGAVEAWAGPALELEGGLVRDLVSILEGADVLAAIGEGRTRATPTRGATTGLTMVAIEPAGAAQVATCRLSKIGGASEDMPGVLQQLLFEQSLAGLGDGLMRAFKMGAVSRADDDAAPPILHDAERYLLVGFEVPLPDGPGVLFLVFELERINRCRAQLGGGAAQAHAVRVSPQRAVLAELMRQSSVKLDAVLDTVSMTLGECCRLEPGQVIPLPAAAMDRLPLRASTIAGPLQISEGRLGVWKQSRAIMLSQPVPEPLAASLETV